MEKQRFFGGEYGCLPSPMPPDALLAEVQRWIEAYFAGEVPKLCFPLAPRGSVFQQRVWQELRRIPYGECMTYGALAQRLGSSARAVGSAVARNPISLIIPCHRVVAAKGELGGYAGGAERKRFLLEWEQGGSHMFCLRGEKPCDTMRA